MNLSWAQLRAVVVVIILVLFFRIILASTDEAKNKLRKELQPFINPFFGYLPSMPYFTLRSLLISFLAEEYAKPPRTSMIFEFNLTRRSIRIRNDDVALLVATYFKLIRPFRQEPFSSKLTEKNGSFLKQLVGQITFADLDIEDIRHRQSSVVFKAGWIAPFEAQWNEDVPIAIWEKTTEEYTAKWSDLVKFFVSGWYRYEELQRHKVHDAALKIFLDKAPVCNEAALLWTVFESIKNTFDDGTKDFQNVLNDFQKFLKYQKTDHLLSYTLQLGISYNLLVTTGNGQLQAEFQSRLAGLGDVHLFADFLLDLGLVPEYQTVDFKYADSCFTQIDVDLSVPGWRYFRSLNPLNLTITMAKTSSPFVTIFEGFKQYQEDQSLVKNDVFRWRQVIHFIVSYGYMFKTMVAGRPTLPPTVPSTVLPPKKAPPAPTQPNVTKTGCWNRTKAYLPWWSEQALSAAIDLVFGSIWLYLAFSEKATKAAPINTFNTTAIFQPTEPAQEFSWIPVIVILVVVVLFGLAIWWWYWWICQAGRILNEVDKKRKVKVVKRNKALKVNSQQPTSIVSSATLAAFISTVTGNSPSPIRRRRQTKTSAASPKWSPSSSPKRQSTVSQLVRPKVLLSKLKKKVKVKVTPKNSGQL